MCEKDEKEEANRWWIGWGGKEEEEEGESGCVESDWHTPEDAGEKEQDRELWLC